MGKFRRHVPVEPPLSDGGKFHVGLLGGFQLMQQGRVLTGLTAGSQRLLGFLALRERSVNRTWVADTLWPDASEEHAHSSLRSAISRLPRAVHDTVLVSANDIRLAEQVDVDLRTARALAHRVLDGGTLQPGDLGGPAIASLSAELLPNWYDDWAVVEAENWRQLRLHALEAIAVHLLNRGRFSDATGAALLATQAEPLRESAHAVLIRIHIAEGNQSEAMAAFAQYKALLQEELGIEPTNLLSKLVSDLGS